MSNVRRSAGSENGKNAGVIEAGGVCGIIINLEAENESISVHVFRATRRVIYRGTAERGMSAIGIGDDERVLGEGAQDPAGIVEEFKNLVAGVEDGHCDLQVLKSINLDIGGRGLDSQAGSSTGGDGRNDEDSEEGTEGRGHCNVNSQGDWRDDHMKTEALRLVESGPNGLRPGGPHGQDSPSQSSHRINMIRMSKVSAKGPRPLVVWKQRARSPVSAFWGYRCLVSYLQRL